MINRIAILASLVLLAAGVGLSHFYLERLEDKVSGGDLVQVLIAVKDVPLGTVLSEELVGVREVPRAFVEQRQIRAADAKRVLGIAVNAGLKANDSVLWSDLARYGGQSRDLAGLIQDGMRAIAIDARAADFGGLLRPGHRVDVLFSNTEAGAEASTVTLLQNLLVLAVGADFGAEAEAADVRGGGTVTLGVTVEESQILTEARRRGRLTLSLRNSGDIVVQDRVPATKASDILAVREQTARLRPTPQKKEIEHVR